MSITTISTSMPQERRGEKMSLSDLITGDIIATNSPGKSSGTIQWSTDSPFSHACFARFLV